MKDYQVVAIIAAINHQTDLLAFQQEYSVEMRIREAWDLVEEAKRAAPGGETRKEANDG